VTTIRACALCDPMANVTCCTPPVLVASVPLVKATGPMISVDDQCTDRWARAAATIEARSVFGDCAPSATAAVVTKAAATSTTIVIRRITRSYAR